MNRLEVYPDEADETMAAVEKRLWPELRHFNPWDDYLLLSGDPTVMVLAASILTQILLSKGVHSYRVLRYDGETKQYYPVTIMF